MTVFVSNTLYDTLDVVLEKVESRIHSNAGCRWSCEAGFEAGLLRPNTDTAVSPDGGYGISRLATVCASNQAEFTMANFRPKNERNQLSVPG